ncbi:MAG: TonB-dependent receptor [Prevotellaceae bacterium]|jgi:TonB-linked SusC/RagA family outer membrane protein|nr:TonB-dependent receptor [Prevotellaceae bacterium]
MSKIGKLKKWSTVIISMLLYVCFPNVEMNAQNLNIKGKVIDTDGNVLPGTAVRVQGTTTGATTDDDGDYVLNNVPTGSVLEYILVGYVTQQIKVAGDKTVINAILLEAAESLEEMTIVAFGKQTKESTVAAITTINPADLRVPSSNLTTALAGRIAGIIAYQRTGEPGQDNAEFFIRGVTTFGTGKKDPLILIDGVEMTTDDLARLTVDDIESFSIMKDANATALYGARGANGVILVTSKEGREGKIRIQLRLENSYSTPTRNMDYADPVTYMLLHNEAIRTRTPIASPRYSTEKILNTERGLDPIRYPATDWREALFNHHTYNQRYNLNASGGGAVARYYIAASYSRDNGIIKMDKRNNFNNNIRIDRYVLRSNINVNFTKTTEAIVRLHGAFDDYSGPLDGGTDLYKKALKTNPVMFPAYYPPDKANIAVNHILFGNAGEGAAYLNPYADMVKGYKDSDRSNMLAQFELKQDLKFITQGLSARGLFNVNRYSFLEFRNGYVPYFYRIVDDPTEYKLEALNPTSGRESVKQIDSSKEITSSMYFEAAVQYNRQFADKHDVSGLLVYTMRESLNGNASEIQEALPFRNIGLAGRATYGYSSRYFVEFNFGYNGSERFAKNERFGFFPSVGVGWIVSNEKFMKPMEKTLSKLKLKATYGMVGNDNIGSKEDRFFYLSKVEDEAGDRSYRFGNQIGSSSQYSRNGVKVDRYADPLITWEISHKTNLGLELNLWKSLEIQVDWFRESRSKILQHRVDVPITMGLQEKPKANIGKASGGGVDMSVDFNKSFSKDVWTVIRGNFTYASSKFDIYEEPNYTNTPWRSHRGQKISQEWGYVAERLFLDEAEVKYSPKQIGDYGAGDIKYKDINGDNYIDRSDMVPIGYPKTPEINYGFGLSAGYKNLDISCFFQGSARSAFWIDAKATAPFVGERALLKYWADNHWSEDDRNIYAMWPRLSETEIDNNTELSTWFMRDGTFLRMKNAEIGYSLPQQWINTIKLQSVRVYVNGSNLLVFSRFKMWDPEMGDNGVAYPLQRVFNFGINITF